MRGNMLAATNAPVDLRNSRLSISPRPCSSRSGALRRLPAAAATG
jgi:hypothetical protein